MLNRFGFERAVKALFPFVCSFLLFGSPMRAQQAASSARQIGTVKAVSGNTLTLATDAGQQVTVTLGGDVRIVQLPPGSTDLKAASAAAVTDIAVGDRVLVTGKPGDPTAQLTALRVVLMKSSDIAHRRAQEQADWQRRGSGGIVSAIDPSAGTITVAEGPRKVQVKTSSSTVFRRYAGDSVKFEDAAPSTFSQLLVGDQLRVRGAKSDDGTSVQAEEIVSGSFRNLSGVIGAIDTADGMITLKDLATKKNMTVKLTPNTDLRALPERAAAMFAARSKGAGPEAGAGGGGEDTRGAGAPGAVAGGRSASMDLSQMLPRLPKQTSTDLKAGDAVMIVASQPSSASNTVTAITLLSGVEPILAASPSGEAMTLSPWSVGSGAPEEAAAP